MKHAIAFFALCIFVFSGYSQVQPPAAASLDTSTLTLKEKPSFNPFTFLFDSEPRLYLDDSPFTLDYATLYISTDEKVFIPTKCPFYASGSVKDIVPYVGDFYDTKIAAAFGMKDLGFFWSPQFQVYSKDQLPDPFYLPKSEGDARRILGLASATFDEDGTMVSMQWFKSDLNKALADRKSAIVSSWFTTFPLELLTLVAVPLTTMSVISASPDDRSIYLPMAIAVDVSAVSLTALSAWLNNKDLADANNKIRSIYKSLDLRPSGP